MPTIRLLPDLRADGPTHMAHDDAMLRSAADGVASLRFYTWEPATLSLGYFQAADARLADARLAELPWVRRPSGGATIVHHHELTYAIALPAGEPWQKRGESWVCRFHGHVVAALRSFGVPVETGLCGLERKLGDVLCFLHHTPGDVILGGHKVVGSAQRRLRGATLQHGSILLRQSEHTPALPGVRELSGKEIPADELKSAVVAALGWDAEAGEWTESEKQHAMTEKNERFTKDSWNGRR